MKLQLGSTSTTEIFLLAEVVSGASHADAEKTRVVRLCTSVWGRSTVELNDPASFNAQGGPLMITLKSCV